MDQVRRFNFLCDVSQNGLLFIAVPCFVELIVTIACVRRAKVGEVPDTQLTVTGLVEGRPYEFRVAAVNEAGPGQYAETDEPIKPEAPPSAPPLLFCCFTVHPDSVQKEKILLWSLNVPD